MPFIECVNHHMFNPDRHNYICPVCGVEVKKNREKNMTEEDIQRELKKNVNQFCVGALVCCEGLNIGSMFALHAGKNFIGGGDDMDVQILGDDKIDLRRHSAVSYDPKSYETVILPGESGGLTYVDDQPVYKPVPLTEASVIEIGAHKFHFLPYCNSERNWRNYKEQ